MATPPYTPKWARKYWKLPAVVSRHWVQTQVERVRLVATEDAEVAHIMEDELHRLVLWVISHRRVGDTFLLGASQILATEVLKTCKLKFARWTG